MNSENKEMRSSKMTSVEGENELMEEDLDMDDADFQVVDCWEDDEAEENETSEADVIFLEARQQQSVPEYCVNANELRKSCQKETKQDEHVHECDSSKTGKSKVVTSSLGTKHNRTSTTISNCSKKIASISESKKSIPLNDENKSSNSIKAVNTGKKSSKSNGEGNQEQSQNKLNEKIQSGSSNLMKKFDKPVVQPDSTETKVENFLREMALQHPQVNHLGGLKHEKQSEDSLQKTLKKTFYDENRKRPKIDLSDLPPGVDLDQVSEDTSTSNLVAATAAKVDAEGACEQSERMTVRGSLNTCPSGPQDKSSLVPGSEGGSSVKPCRIDGRLYADYSKIIPKDKANWCKSNRSYQPGLSKHVSVAQEPRSSAHPFSSSPLRREGRSHSPSLSLSPSPPRFYQQFPSTSAATRVSHVSPSEDTSLHKPPTFVQYPRQPNYRPQSPVRNYGRRSRESSILRALSRSLSKERVRHRSRSGSRPKSFGTRHSGQRRSDSMEDKRRKFNSTSGSKSPSSRVRSRGSVNSTSPSPERHRYRRDRSSSSESNRRKKPRISSRSSPSRSRSRGRSLWKPPAEVNSNEWYASFPSQNGSNIAQDDVRLEHDMERFIATNMAATGQLRQPVVDWLEASHGKDLKPLGDPAFEVMDQSMPLPPPPPDISELMKTNDEFDDDIQVITDQNMSLSSLLESAVSGVPSQAVIDRCQDAIMKLHDVGIKQGRLNIVSTNTEAQPLPPPTAPFPWQSIFHQPNSDKIYFTFTKLPENPVLWEVSESFNIAPKSPTAQPISQEAVEAQCINSYPNHEPSIITNPFYAERSALLEKISFLTKELHEVKQVLDSTQVLKMSVAVQTETHSCVECNKRKELSMNISQTSFETRSSQRPISRQPAPPLRMGSQSSCSSPLSAPAPNLQSTPVPPPSLFSLPTPSLSSVSKMTTPSTSSLSSQLMSTISSQSTPQPVTPSRYPVRHFPIHPQPASGSTSSASLSSNYYPNIDQSNQSWSSNIANVATVSSVKPNPLSLAHLSSNQQAPKVAGDWRNISEKSAPEATSKPVAAAPKKVQKIGGVLDYEIIHHQMVGDEHLFDLVAYFSTTGPSISVDPKYCSPGQTVDKLLQLFSSKTCVIKNQIIIMVGVYNTFNTNWDAYLKKYSHLVGFLRKRCSHLVLVEPPPIPRLVNSLQYWDSVKALANFFKSCKTDNVSVVLTHNLLMQSPHPPLTPNPAFYVNDKRLSGSGLQIIADELLRVLSLARDQKKGMTS